MTHLITFGDLSWFMLLPSILSIGLGLNYVILEKLFNLGLAHQLFLYATNNSLSKISMFFLNMISKKRERKTKMNLFTRLTQAYIRPSNQSDFHEIKKSLSKNNCHPINTVMFYSSLYLFHIAFYFPIHQKFHFDRRKNRRISSIKIFWDINNILSNYSANTIKQSCI